MCSILSLERMPIAHKYHQAMHTDPNVQTLENTLTSHVICGMWPGKLPGGFARSSYLISPVQITGEDEDVALIRVLSLKKLQPYIRTLFVSYTVGCGRLP